MVSIVMPTYERTQEMVFRAIKSIENQTYSDWELYVVDDNKDEEKYSIVIKEAIEQKADKRIHYLKMEKNSGACAARNRGIEASKGEYIAFLDDDDEWTSEKLELQLPLMEEQKVGFSYSGMLIFNELTGTSKSLPIRFEKGNVYQKLLKTNFMGGTPGVIIKREALQKCGGFSADMPAAQDYELWLRLAQKYDVASIAKDLVIVHIHAGDSITKSLERRIQGFRKIIEKYHEDIVKDKEIYSFQLYTLGKFLVLNKEYHEGFELVLKAIKMKPLKALYYIAVISYWKINYWIKGL